MKTFYLIDGHAQIFRAYYAPFGAPLSSPSGEPTKAVFVFTQVILSILREQKPDYVAVALDVSDETTDRRKMYPQYKAHRDKTPEDLPRQVERIVEVLDALEIPIYSAEGQEADDVIATIASRLEAQPVELRVVSRDKDLHQILSDKVKLWDPSKPQPMDAKLLEEELGYSPAQAVEIQVLRGDSTDNVPGVPGIGPKRAVDLIRKYGTVEEVVSHAHELTPKLRESVLASAGQLGLTRRLITLNRHVDVDFDLEACAARPASSEKLRTLFEELGFRRLLETLESSEAGTAGAAGTGAAGVKTALRAEGRYHLVNTPAKLEDFLDRLGGQRRFAIDTETTSLYPVDCDLVGFSFSWKAAEGWYLPVRSNTGSTLDPETTLRALKPLLEDDTTEKCGQNIKYDIVVLRRAGIQLKGVTFDSMVASYVLDPERRNHSMDALARDHLGCGTIPISELIGKGRQQISMLDVDLGKLCEYAGEDADITWRLQEVLSAKLESSPVKDLFRDVEMPLVQVLADMEFQGVALDSRRLRAFSKDLEERISGLLGEIHSAAGREFTVDSPRQLAEVLFDEQGLRVVKKTKTSRSTDASVLRTLAVETAHPLPMLILKYRELSKLRSTYVDPLPGLVSPRTKRIHASFHQTVAATGRLSSSNPNLQNIPVRTEQGREIRRAFVPSGEERVLITADYSQIELRILAHLSKDPALIEAFRSDQDIHEFVASQIYGVPQSQVTGEQRTRAKAVNFGIIYGQGAFGLAQSLGISRKEAAEFIGQYKERYSGIVRFMDECVSAAEKEGSVATMLGRRRPIPEIRSRNRAVRAQGERLAINTVVQGSAADMIKVAMVRIHRRVLQDGLDLFLLIQVHDELVFEAPRCDAPQRAEMIRQEMENALPLDVPLRVDVAWGDNWLEGKR